MLPPTLEELVRQLSVVAEIDDLDPDRPIEELGVESIDILEWFYVLEEEYSIKVSDEFISELSPEMTLRQVFDRLPPDMFGPAPPGDTPYPAPPGDTPYPAPPGDTPYPGET